VKPGFDPHNLVTTRTSLEPRLADKARVDQIVQDAFRRLIVVPGVEDIAYTRLLPLEGSFNSLPVVVVGRSLRGTYHGMSRWMVVSSRYFDVLKIPVLRGRSFTDADRPGTPGVAIVNQTMARELWRNDDPLGAQILIGRGVGAGLDEPARQVIGVVRDVHDNTLGEPPQPAVFVPGSQLSDARTMGRSVAWVIRIRERSSATSSRIVSDLRRATGEPVPPLRGMEEIISKSTSLQKFRMLLMSIFAACALALAAIGVYAVFAYNVEQRTPEMGIRMAIGAQPGEVRALVLREGMILASVGIALGTTAAFGLTRFLAKLLFGVKAVDPGVFILVPVFVCCVALAALWIPARRAAGADPLVALYAISKKWDKSGKLMFTAAIRRT
jgi:putative ABC transport system permease protein